MLLRGTRLAAAKGFSVSWNISSQTDFGADILSLGEHNNATFPPQYCPPAADCQSSRLMGQSCAPQGTFEPVVCEAGFYCPKEGGKIRCPAGSFCRIGSYEATKCSPGSSCKEGAIRDMSFLPMGILIIVDILLITAVIIGKIQSRYRSKHPKASKNKGLPFGGIPFRSNKQYKEIGDDSYPSAMESGIPMQNNMDFRPDFRRRPTGFEQLGLEGAEFALHDELHDNNGASRTDLQQFVQSLSRILGATKFGLNFEFQNLHFQPKKNPKPILSDVTGMIDAGSLWGVMGASGAGKCECLFIWK